MPNTVFVIANDGTRLMPTNIKRARKLLKRKEAVIFKHRPFTIKLTRNSEHNVQDVECCIDTGSGHIGISIKSLKHEYVHAQYDNLKDEVEKHKDQRKAVFYRDNYTCQCCGKTIKDGAIFNVHHIGFWKGDRTNRMSNLMTVCTKCHTSKNHQPDGKLYGLESKTSNLSNSAFMNTVRYAMVDDFKKEFPDVKVFTTYGAETKLKRKELHILKTHANDAYAMCYSAI